MSAAKPSSPYYRVNWVESQVYFSAFHIGAATLRDYVAGFNRYQPRVLTGYASSYFSLARMMLERRIALNYVPEAVVLCAEKVTPEMKQTIERAFGARAYEEYSSVEQCVLATECEAGRLHVSPDFGLVEIVDDQGKPVPPGTTGNIVCTGLLNDAHVLIRYRLGDLGAWAIEPCPCGRNQFPVLKEIVGRIEDVLQGPDGREMVRVHNFSSIPHILEAQIIQEKLDLFVVKVVPGPGFGCKEEQLIREKISTERLGRVHVLIERVEKVERTERGKFRGVINHYAKQTHTASDVHPGRRPA